MLDGLEYKAKTGEITKWSLWSIYLTNVKITPANTIKNTTKNIINK